MDITRSSGDKQVEASALWKSSLVLHQIGDQHRTLARAGAALDLFEQLSSPAADSVRERLAEWREVSDR
jgi:hypothetical protein